jgi:hypothetical protein
MVIYAGLLSPTHAHHTGMINFPHAFQPRMELLHPQDILCHVTPASSSRFFTSILSGFEFTQKHPLRFINSERMEIKFHP